MKIVKIFLAIAVIAIIGFFIRKWLVDIDKPPEIPPKFNQSTKNIHNKIISLKQMPANVFCQKFYNDIQYLIIDNYKLGLLGESVNDNKEWKEIFSKNLYSAYAPKFVEQAMFVFSRSEWDYDDLKFIRSEVNALTQSSYLDPSSPVANSFSSISTILAKYDDITGFISTCNGYSYSNFDLNSSFPDVSDKILKSRAYLANNLDNQYVNNCTRLKDGLQKIPKNLFDKHVSYLNGKINNHGGRYAEFNYQSDYSRIIYTPLKNQIDGLDKETYGISVNLFDSGYNSLDNLLSTYNRKATDYFLKILGKIDEINKFISSCNGFSYSNSDLNSSFPDVSDKIQKSREYLTNNLDGLFLNNSARIKDGLKEVPKKLFDKHVSFLKTKINENGGKFTEFKNQSDYSMNIYIPLSNQIKALNNNIYGLSKSVFDIGYISLDNLLKKFNDTANDYYINPRRWIRQNRRDT
jgi:hypothetical protein